MTKEQIIEKMLHKASITTSIVYLIGALGMLQSIFIAIWYSWSIAWKVGLTGFVLVLVSSLAYKFYKDVVKKVVEDNMKDNPADKKFAEKLKQLLKEQELKSKSE